MRISGRIARGRSLRSATSSIVGSWTLFAIVAAIAWVACSCSGKPLALNTATSTARASLQTAGASSSPLIGSTTGKQPPFTPVNSSWKSHSVSGGELPPFRYPPDWQVTDVTTESTDLYPPTSDTSGPAPIIAVAFLPTNPFASFAPDDGLPAPRLLTVGGVTGWEVDSTSQLAPQLREVALPYKSGTLVLTAYEGPGVDLTPFIEPLLSTMQFSH